MALFTFIFVLKILILTAQNKVNAIIENSINKEELSKVLAHFNKPEDALKYKAVCFLIENMSAHNAYNFYWTDSLNQKIEFDELAYSDLTSSINAFDALKTKYGKVHPIPTVLNDLDHIKADFLIDNIEQAFAVWNPKQYDFKTFCEYILPYRVEVEPLQKWREKYNQKYTQLFDNQSNTLQDKIKTIADENNKWFLCTYNIETRSEPLPRLGAMQLWHRKKGTCEDVADLTALTLRSIGIPATTDIVPLWATSTVVIRSIVLLTEKAKPFILTCFRWIV